MFEFPIAQLIELINKESHVADRVKGVEAVELYQELEVYYRCALDEVETKLFIIDRELSSNSHRGRKNSIHQIQKRIKRFKSVVNKLSKKQVNYSQAMIIEHIQDFAGLRVICSYSDDIYTLIDSLSRHPDIHILKIKDYLKHPKPSGYRSVHVVLEVPVYFLEETKRMKVEIQFRTIAMDFWASLEHSLRYKNNIDSPELSKKLQNISEDIEHLENEMLNIRKGIESLAKE
ncbi:(p)ppGpp synthetase [Enterococcus villorum]|uniref:(P)ppGpp synthetase n=1 Tax=Enterococcus villorum TaxID=112904 RepID=A0A1V8YNR2_9ENTE|nr:(p)ppGpp synthetase [Enterococcus villorum]OQO70557.1 (p)ppGpp synthetase [Enterococcus villorum]OQO74275.1 (p)ppGpp synthetase [Enterococcus villorum]